MPALTLQVVSIDAAPVAQPTMHAFEESGGSIGRDDTNFLSLPDKHRRVSRLHATISFPGGMPTITNSSTSLPLSVGEQQLDGGESMPITQGALIEIGPYILQAHSGSSALGALPQQQPPTMRRDTMPTVAPSANAFRVQAATPAINFPGADPLANWPAADSGASLLGLAAPSTPAANPWPGQIGSDFTPIAAAPAGNGADMVNPLGAFPAADLSARPASIPDADPFADLLAGIGNPPAPPSSLSSLGASSPAPYKSSTQPGLSDDPLAAFGGAVPTQGDSLLGRTHGDVISQRATPGGGLPGDFNPFDMPSSSGRNAADPLAGLLGTSNNVDPRNGAAVSGGTPSIDSLFQSGSLGSTDTSLFGFAPVVRGGDGTIEGLIRSDTTSDPMSLFDSAEAPAAPLARPMRDDSMEVGSAFSPPLANLPNHPNATPQRPSADMIASVPANALAAPSVAVGNPLAFAPMPTPSRVAQPAAPVMAREVTAASPQPLAQPRHVAPPPSLQSSSPTPQATAVTPLALVAAPVVAASPDALTDAFLRGAGLAPTALPQGLTPEIMTIVGSLLRSATAGAVDMLAARAATKREVQASVTIISVQANNPLKFLPNADAALLQLLDKKMPGFMRADVAMRDAFDDLRAHEVGVIAGTRAALTEVLGKFDPAVLGDKQAKGSVIESLMPSARKAKLWDMYLERYLQIRREAEDDFQSIFGRAFVQAYERETARIKGESPMAGGE